MGIFSIITLISSALGTVIFVLLLEGYGYFLAKNTKMKTESPFNIIRNYIRNGDTEKALNKLAKICDPDNDSKTQDSVYLLQNRYSILKRKMNKGLLNSEEETIERNKIIEAILSETRDLEENSKEREISPIEYSSDKALEEDIFRITKTALITIELEKIKEEFYDSDWNNRNDVLRKLLKYSDHTTYRLADHVFVFLDSIASQTRSGLNFRTAYTIQYLVISFFPRFEKGTEDNEFEYFASQAINIGFSLFYDAALYLKNLSVGIQGLSILKWAYLQGKKRDLENIMSRVIETFEELEGILKGDRAGTENNDLAYAKELLQIFKEDIDHPGLAYPLMPEPLFEIIWNKKK